MLDAGEVTTYGGGVAARRPIAPLAAPVLAAVASGAHGERVAIGHHAPPPPAVPHAEAAAVPCGCSASVFVAHLTPAMQRTGSVSRHYFRSAARLGARFAPAVLPAEFVGADGRLRASSVLAAPPTAVPGAKATGHAQP